MTETPGPPLVQGNNGPTDEAVVERYRRLCDGFEAIVEAWVSAWDRRERSKEAAGILAQLVITTRRLCDLRACIEHDGGNGESEADGICQAVSGEAERRHWKALEKQNDEPADASRTQEDS